VVLLVPPLLLWFLPDVHRAANGAQSADIFELVLLLPAGAALALLWSALKQPNPWMLGPLCASAALSVAFDFHLSLPPGLGELGQWLIGCALGCYFDRSFFRSAPHFLTWVLLATLLAMSGALLLGLALACVFGADSLSLMLGMMPGGIAEMTLTAQALQLSVALVTALQVLRLFLLVFLASPIYLLWQIFSRD